MFCRTKKIETSSLAGRNQFLRFSTAISRRCSTPSLSVPSSVCTERRSARTFSMASRAALGSDFGMVMFIDFLRVDCSGT